MTTTTPPNTTPKPDAIDELLSTLAGGEHSLKVYRVGPQGLEICQTYTVDTFSEEAVARTWGSGAYELHIYERGKRGMQAKRPFRVAAPPGESSQSIAPPPRPAPQNAPSAYTMPAEAGVFGMLMQMQQQQFQMQLEAAKADRAMFLSLIEKIGQKSDTMPEINAMEQMMRFADKLTRNQDRDGDSADALVKMVPGIIEAMNKPRQPIAAPRSTLPPGQRLPQLTRSGAPTTNGAMPGPRRFENGQPVDPAPAATEDAPSAALPDSVQTLIQVLRIAVTQHDPDPATYSNVVIDLLGEDTIQAAIDGYDEGHFAGMLGNLDPALAQRRDFLLAVEREVRAAFLDSEGDPADTTPGVSPASASSPPVDAADASHASQPAAQPTTDGDAAAAKRSRPKGARDVAHNARSRA